MILNDKQIRTLALQENMIEPFTPIQVRYNDNEDRVISYGLSSFGYDFRLANELYIFSNAQGVTSIDPKNFDERAMVKVVSDEPVALPPNSYMLGHSIEYVRMPPDVLSICTGKSTYARCGIHVNITPLECGWQGHITIEISNGTTLPVLIYPNEGILQAVFFQGNRPQITYADRKGKYQGQEGVTFARV